MLCPADARAGNEGTRAAGSSSSGPQAWHKAKPDTGKVNTVFKVGGRVLLRTKNLLGAADIGKLLPRRDGPFTATAAPTPTRSRSHCGCSAARQSTLTGSSTPTNGSTPFQTSSSSGPGPVPDAVQEGEH